MNLYYTVYHNYNKIGKNRKPFCCNEYINSEMNVEKVTMNNENNWHTTVSRLYKEDHYLVQLEKERFKN